MRLIPHSKPWITREDLFVMNRTIQSGMIAQGEKTQEFEHAMSSWVGGDNGVAVGSGSAAIVLALAALGIKKDDEVVLPTYICTSVLEAVLTFGATPRLCDIGPDWLVTPENMYDVITKKTKAIIVPHMYGIFADVDSFRQFGVHIIEDCAQAVDYRGKRKIAGDIATFSFHPTKCLTTGEGGMAVSSDTELLTLMRSVRDGTKQSSAGRFFSPMSDISASLGISQLSHYHKALDRRKVLAQKYMTALKNIIPDGLPLNGFKRSMYFRFPIKIAGGVDLYQELFEKKSISVRRGVDKLLHRVLDIADDKFKIAETLFNTTVSLPLYPALTDEEHEYCTEAAISIFSDIQ